MRPYHTSPVGLVIGLFIIFVGLLILRAALRQFGQGSCLTGCCLWEMGDSILDLGCSMIGCGGVLGLIALPLVAWFGWLHR